MRYVVSLVTNLVTKVVGIFFNHNFTDEKTEALRNTLLMVAQTQND